VEAVQSFHRLDKIAYKIGLLTRNQSYTNQIAWWPLVSILGTYSAGKSTFINHYIRFPLQNTGTQAVDDKFTVICYTQDEKAHVLPGIALNSDPRFPFYKMSEELEKVKPGEGARVDAYLQLKTCPSDRLRGSILIDSPGFDADAQRTATLRITDYIIDLSDLVLVFFDARHPEPGTMQDTLKHLVGNTVTRRDSSKFLYILNQIDTTAREDNPEDVVGAWHRAIAQEGLTAGKFYCVYNPDAAIPIEDPSLRGRFEEKRDKDLVEIHERIRHVGLERAYRIVGALEKTAQQINEDVPRLFELMRRWRNGVLLRDAVFYALLIAGLIAAFVRFGFLTWDPVGFKMPGILHGPWGKWSAIVLAVALLVGLHFVARKWAVAKILKSIQRTSPLGFERESLTNALQKQTRWWRSIFNSRPVGWGRRARKRIKETAAVADRLVQTLNDHFATPSGETAEGETPDHDQPGREEDDEGSQGPSAAIG
jgi:hypothetical protein